MNSSATTRSILATILLCLLTAGLGCASSSASHQPTEAWNQQAVTALAGKLVTSAHGLYTTLYEDPPIQSVDMSGSHDSLGATIRVLSESAGGLRAKLERGNGREETLGTYKHIKELSRDAAEVAGFTNMAMDATQGYTGLKDLLKQLDGYYGDY